MSVPEPGRATETVEDALEAIEGFPSLTRRAQRILQRFASEEVVRPFVVRRWVFDLSNEDLLSRQGCGIRTLNEINAWRQHARLIGDYPILTGEAESFVDELITEARDLVLNIERLGVMLRVAKYALSPREPATREQSPESQSSGE